LCVAAWSGRSGAAAAGALIFDGFASLSGGPFDPPIITVCLMKKVLTTALDLSEKLKRVHGQRRAKTLNLPG